MPALYRAKVIAVSSDASVTRGHNQAGPIGDPCFVWAHKTLYFGADPVSIDRIGLQVIDEKRVAAKMKPSAQAGPGESDRAKIDFRKLTA
jgi:hypothetical protein